MGEFSTKEGGRIARAEEGEILVGANPFGICCSECGNVMKMAYTIDGEDLSILLTNDDEESARYREHFQILSQVVLYETIAKARQVIANHKATLEHLVAGIRIAQDGIQHEIDAQRLSSIVGPSKYLTIAEDALSSLLPKQEKEQQRLILVPGGRG